MGKPKNAVTDLSFLGLNYMIKNVRKKFGQNAANMALEFLNLLKNLNTSKGVQFLIWNPKPKMIKV